MARFVLVWFDQDILNHLLRCSTLLGQTERTEICCSILTKWFCPTSPQLGAEMGEGAFRLG